MTLCACGHVYDEHDPEDLFCYMELEDGTKCPCFHYESVTEQDAEGGQR